MQSNTLTILNKIKDKIRCVKCNSVGDFDVISDKITCCICKAEYLSTNGVLSFIDTSDEGLRNVTDIESKTNTYFGFEWDYYSQWGFIDDSAIEDSQKEKYFGGLVSHRKRAFDSKCRMDADDLDKGNIVLDAGCGNGRYTFEAATRGGQLLLVLI